MEHAVQSAYGAAFRRLHDGPGCFLMPNAWSAGSARLLAAEGFEALATTSAGIAFALGRPDGAGCVDRRTMLSHVGAIAAAVSRPVSADLEDGYGPAPEDVAETIRGAVAAGVVGANIEDARPDGGLYEIQEAADRLRAAREAADATGIPFTLTGRTDVFLSGHPGGFDEAVRRLNRYREAGADCLFAPGLADLEGIRALARAVNGPLTVVVGLAGSPVTVEQLQECGVRRVSIGGTLARSVFGLIRRSAREMAAHGTFGFADGQISHAELQAFFRKDD